MTAIRPPAGQRRPEIIAHRGTPRQHPENSLPSFRHALELGADGIELDVHLTSDDAVVVHHDPALTGRNSAPGAPAPRIRELTLAELRTHVLAPGVPVPTLDEVLSLVGSRAVVYIEIKAPNAEQAVMRCVTASSVRCAVHSFDHRVARRVAQLESAPGTRPLPTGILSASYLIEPLAALRAARARDYWQQWDLIDEALVTAVHGAGGRVVAWTVNDITEARRLAQMGVDGLCTDVCGALAEARLSFSA